MSGTLRIADMVTAEGTCSRIVAISVQGLSPDSLTLVCPNKSVSLVRRQEVKPSTSAGPAYAWTAHGDTAIIILRKFGGSDRDIALLEQFVRYYAKHRRFRRLVFDVRGNTGGSDRYVFQWIEQAKRGLWKTGVVWVNYDSALGPCRQWNDLVWRQVISNKVDTAESVKHRDQLRSQWLDQALHLSLRAGGRTPCY